MGPQGSTPGVVQAEFRSPGPARGLHRTLPAAGESRTRRVLVCLSTHVPKAKRLPNPCRAAAGPILRSEEGCSRSRPGLRPSDTKRLVLDLDGRNGTATDGTTGRLEAPATPGSCLCWSSHNTPKGHSPRTIISVSAQPVGVPPASLDTLAPLWTEPCRGARGVWSHPLRGQPMVPR